MTLNCECGNKNPKRFEITAYISGPYCSDNEPGSVYIHIKCKKCRKGSSINEIGYFNNKILISDEYHEEYLDFSRSY
jgi:hypothetical protein